MGVRITGPACWVRISIATPDPKSVAATFTRTASPIRPKRSKPPLMGIPVSSARTVTSAPVVVTRTSEAIA
jgi:hypothetical protein